MSKLLVAAGGACLIASGSATAAVIPYTATSSAPVNNSLALLSDGFIPPDMTPYDAPTNVYFGNPSTTITFTFAGPVSIGSMLATVDNNDDYIFTFFNGATQTGQATILASDGMVTAQDGGVETFAGNVTTIYTYEPSLRFATPITATTAVLSIGANDDALGVAEVQFNTPTVRPGAVPEPTSWAMFIGGFGLIGAGMRRRRTSVSFA